MLPMITNLISMGYVASDILNFIGKKVKHLNKGIEEARVSGHKDEDILKFISGKMPKGKKKDVDRVVSDQEKYLKNIGIKTKEEKQESTRKGINTAIGVGATALGAYGLYNQYSKRFPKGEWDFNKHHIPEEATQIGGQAQSQIPYNPGMEKGPKGPNQFQMVPGNKPIQPPQQMMKAAKQPGMNPLQSEAMQPPGSLPTTPPSAESQAFTNPQPSIDPIQAEKYLKDKGVLDQVKTMMNRNTPEEMTALLSGKGGPGRVRGGEDPELLMNIKAYKEAPKPNVQVNEVQGQIQPTEEQRTANQLQLGNPSQETSQAPKTEKPKPQTRGDVVSLPNGEIGTIEDLKKDHAVVEVDGKKRPVKLEDLQPPTFSEEETADAYDNLMEKIPEEHKSGFISWSGYDEDLNKLGFIPRGGKYEELHNITPKEAQLIKEGKGTARTSGETREGLWVLGEDTRGGIISQIIHDRRKKHKASEEQQLKFDFKLEKPEKQDKGMKPIFDEMAYPRGLSQERDKKKKLEEKLKIKQEKERLKNEEKERNRKRKKQA